MKERPKKPINLASQDEDVRDYALWLVGTGRKQPNRRALRHFLSTQKLTLAHYRTIEEEVRIYEQERALSSHWTARFNRYAKKA